MARGKLSTATGSRRAQHAGVFHSWGQSGFPGRCFTPQLQSVLPKAFWEEADIIWELQSPLSCHNSSDGSRHSSPQLRAGTLPQNACRSQQPSPFSPTPKIWWGRGQYPLWAQCITVQSQLRDTRNTHPKEVPPSTRWDRNPPHKKRSCSLRIQGSRSSDHRSAPSTQQTRTQLPQVRQSGDFLPAIPTPSQRGGSFCKSSALNPSRARCLSAPAAEFCLPHGGESDLLCRKEE